MSRLDERARLAVSLAQVNAILGAISIDANLAEFASDQQLTEFRACLSRARREVQRAELDLHDLLLSPAAFAASEHEAIVHVRQGTRYFTDDEEEVPEMPLYRYDCSCGHEGLGWYAEQGRARRNFDRHIPAAVPA